MVGVKKEFYALKCIDKKKIEQSNLDKYIKNEKDVMKFIDFPFCMQFIADFEDKNYIFFLTEFIRGIELFDAIRDIGSVL